MIARRKVMTAAAMSVLAATAARADFISAPDVVVYCDPAWRAAMRAVGDDFRARTGVPVRVLAAPATLLLELLARGTRSDVLVTLAPQMDAPAGRTLIKPQTRTSPWRDPVVLAARDLPASLTPLDADRLRALLGDGRLAVIDPVGPDRMDGPATVARLGWADVAAGRVDGMATGQEVAASLASGASRLGLLHRSDLVGQSSLASVGTVAEAAAPAASVEAAISRTIQSRYAEDFMAYLVGAEATVRLRGFGLERQS